MRDHQRRAPEESRRGGSKVSFSADLINNLSDELGSSGQNSAHGRNGSRPRPSLMGGLGLDGGSDHSFFMQRSTSTSSLMFSNTPESMHIMQQSTPEQAQDQAEATNPIDTIFNYLDPHRTGTVSSDDLKAVLDTIGEADGNVLMRASSRNLGDMTKEDLCEILFSKEKRTLLQSWALWVLIWILPAFYAASTRLPFICLAVEVTEHRGGDLWQVSVLLGTYQSCRALANYIIATFGGPDPMRRLHILMICVGAAGWAIAGIPRFDSVWTLFALCGVGLSESVVNLQTSVIHETRAESPSNVADPLVLEHRIRIQYATVAGGVFVCWLIGGWLYTHYGFQAMSFLGLACHAIQFAGTLFFRRFAASEDKRKERMKVLKTDADLLPNRHTDGQVFLRSITYRIKGMSILAQEAADVFSGKQSKVSSDLDQAAVLAKDDVVLQGSLKLLYRAFFRPRKGRRPRPSMMVKGGNLGAVSAISNMLQSIENAEMSLSQKDHFDMTTDISSSLKNRSQDVTMMDCAEIAVQLMDMDGDGQISEKEFAAYLAPRVYASVFQMGSAQHKTVDVIWPYMKAVVLTQAMMALCIGTFLSTALLMYTRRFGVTTATVGLLLAVGEGLGAGLIFASSWVREWLAYRKAMDQEWDNGEPGTVMSAIVSRPLHLPFVLFLVGAATIGFTCPVFWVAIFFQMVMSALNDPSVSFLNELIATSIPPNQFRYYQGLGQWLRRLGNVVTGVFGPFLFGYSQSLPFALFGGIVILWGAMLWYLLYNHAVKLQQKPGDDQVKDASCAGMLTEPFNPFRETSKTPWHVMEQIYFSEHREEIEEELAPSRSQAINLTVLDFKMRRMGAYHRTLELELKKEKKARTLLEERLFLLEHKEPPRRNQPKQRNPSSSSNPPLRQRKMASVREEDPEDIEEQPTETFENENTSVVSFGGVTHISC